eukprot:GHVT01041432.1.p1 GENE.GHVT01041432.1~~GHVT01041432.1.p1  ORF type:complete len:745 (+),score=178.43 GHVT01041432.1:969-3203(+)
MLALVSAVAPATPLSPPLAPVRLGQNGRRRDPRQCLRLLRELSLGDDMVAAQSLFEIGHLYLHGPRGFRGVGRDVPAAFAAFSSSAGLGFGPALHLMSFAAASGVGVGQEADEGVAGRLEVLAASTGHIPAMLGAGFRYLYGEGLPKDCERALLYYKAVAEATLQSAEGPAFPPLQDGDRLSTDTLRQWRKINEAQTQQHDVLEYWKQQAKGGDPMAQYEFARLLEEGSTNKQDVEEAARLYKEAGEGGGLLAALRDSGLLHLHGVGVERNVPKALEMLEKAASLGDPESLNYLGYLFYFADESLPEVRRNRVKAVEFFTAAASQDFPESLFFLAEHLIDAYGDSSPSPPPPPRQPGSGLDDIVDVLSNVLDWVVPPAALGDALPAGGLLPDDPMFQRQWGMYNSQHPGVDSRVTYAWALTQKLQLPQRPVVVAHIDTGVEISHPDLRANIWTNPGEIPGNGIDDDGNGFIDDVHGWNFAEDNADVVDTHSHGTHTAGVIAAKAGNHLGVAGVSNFAMIMPLRFKNLVSDVVQAIDYSLLMGATVSTNSWGFTALASALETAMINTMEADQLFVCAVDNRGMDNTWYADFPPNLLQPNQINVAGLTSSGILDYTSNYGRQSVHLAAPGRGVFSTWTGSRYGNKDGTSTATPFVAGVAAMLLSSFPELSTAQVKDLLLSTVTPLPALQGLLITGGIINAEGALQKAVDLYGHSSSSPPPNALENEESDALGDDYPSDSFATLFIS